MTKRIFFALCALTGAILMVASLVISYASLYTSQNASPDIFARIFSPISIAGMSLLVGGGLLSVFFG